MSGNTPIRGIRDPIPGGTIVGNLGSSSGPPYAIRFNTLAKAVANAIPAGTLFGPILNGEVVANVSGATTVPGGTTVTALLDATMGNARGDILYRNATSWTVLAPGTSGFLLMTGGAGADPSWADEAHKGTVTSITAGTFLTGGTITTTGTIGMAPDMFSFASAYG